MVVASAVGTAKAGGFTGAGLLAGGCGIMWELNPPAVGGFKGAGLLAGGCGISSDAGGFTGAGLLAGGCGITWELNPRQQSELQQ